MEWVGHIAEGSILLIAILMGLAGIILSCLSISGTWLVALAAVLTTWLSKDGYPGWIAVGVFLLLSGLVELAELVSSSLGVAKKGGSRLAGWAALGGAVLGMIIGSFFLPPVGSLLGMIIGSFLCVYLLDKKRLENDEQAMDIAAGAVIARILVIFIKVGVTAGMMIWLVFSAFV